MQGNGGILGATVRWVSYREMTLASRSPTVGSAITKACSAQLCGARGRQEEEEPGGASPVWRGGSFSDSLAQGGHGSTAQSLQKELEF